MSDETSLYPAINVKIGRHNRRLYHPADLKTAVRLGDIRNDTRIIYEAELGHRAEMAARDCPLLTDLLEEFGRPEEETDTSAATSQKEAKPETATGSPWQGPGSQPASYAADIVTDYNDIDSPADLLDFDETYLPYALNNRTSEDPAILTKDKRPRFWLIPDDEEDHKAHLVPGSDSYINWEKYREKSAENPFAHHFLMLPGERLKLIRPAVMVKGADGWELLEQGVIEGFAEPEAKTEEALPPAAQPYAEAAQPNDNIVPEMQLPPEKSKTRRNVLIVLGLLGSVFLLEKCMQDGSFSRLDDQTGDTRPPNMCEAVGQGYVSRNMAREADTLYMDRDTNVRAGAGVSSRKVGTVKRGEQLELRRARDKSQENWYQITSGAHCGHYVYSYAATPPDTAPPAFISQANTRREVQEDTPLLDRPDGRIIGTVPAGRTVSYVGEVAGGYSEIIDASQDNALGYIALSAFEKKTRATDTTGLAVENTCSYPVRIYIRMEARGPNAQGAITLRAGEKRPALTYTDGTKVRPISAEAQIYAERDDFTMDSAQLQGWRPDTRAYTAEIDENDNYLISPECE